MLSKIKSGAILGIDGYIVDVETYVSRGIPAFEIVGLGDAAVRESKERVRAAIRNTGLEFPARRITVNLAPANQRKEGSAFDLPIALGILSATGQINAEKTEASVFVGELSLDGKIKPVKGVLSIAMCAREKGFDSMLLPARNADEASVVSGLDIFPVSDLNEAVMHITDQKPVKKHISDIGRVLGACAGEGVDFSDVKGQKNVKRALEVAASGGHNILMIGSPGAGKTMIARRLPTILPPLTFEEALEVTRIHSAAGLLPPGASLVTTRPFRAPHHSISAAGLAGGGRIPKPGEISLAHFGVLFLDELPEFGRDALEVLRQPLEDGEVTISRVNACLTYPSRTMLVCAANPCKCGNFLDRSKVCTCTPPQIRQYLGKISKPLLDRMDLHIEVPSVGYADLEDSPEGENSAVIRERVDKARKVQLERYKGLNVFSNSQLLPFHIEKFCILDGKGRKMLREAFEKLGLSARAHNRILKVSRSIADMEGSEDIMPSHLAEAIQYRSLDRRFWTGG